MKIETVIAANRFGPGAKPGELQEIDSDPNGWRLGHACEPGLAKGDLYEGRDLYPTTDLRSVFKAVLADHLLIPAAYIEREVFPDSAAAKQLDDLIRS